MRRIPAPIYVESLSEGCWHPVYSFFSQEISVSILVNLFSMLRKYQRIITAAGTLPPIRPCINPFISVLTFLSAQLLAEQFLRTAAFEQISQRSNVLYYAGETCLVVLLPAYVVRIQPFISRHQSCDMSAVSFGSLHRDRLSVTIIWYSQAYYSTSP